jgi:hypothetical protein
MEDRIISGSAGDAGLETASRRMLLPEFVTRRVTRRVSVRICLKARTAVRAHAFAILSQEEVAQKGEKPAF